MKEHTKITSSIAHKKSQREIIEEYKEKKKYGYVNPVRQQRKMDSKDHSRPQQYNYKIKYVGKRAESIMYSEPIMVGYSRKHNPERRENRTMSNEQNTKRARRNVHDIVNANMTEYTKMLTLTYAETMLDYERLAHDWKMFRQYMKRKGFNPPYLYIVEHQTKRGKREGNKGSLHIHALLFTDRYIPYDTIKEAWGRRGSVHIEKVDEAENSGAYVAKYITKDGTPADKKSYRTSRNVKRPTYEMGLGNELDVVTAVRSKGYKHVDTYDYTVERGVNQDTGEIKEQATATVSKYER